MTYKSIEFSNSQVLESLLADVSLLIWKAREEENTNSWFSFLIQIRTWVPLIVGGTYLVKVWQQKLEARSPFEYGIGNSLPDGHRPVILSWSHGNMRELDIDLRSFSNFQVFPLSRIHIFHFLVIPKFRNIWLLKR